MSWSSSKEESYLRDSYDVIFSKRHHAHWWWWHCMHFQGISKIWKIVPRKGKLRVRTMDGKSTLSKNMIRMQPSCRKKFDLGCCTGPYLTNFLQNLAWRHHACPINELWLGWGEPITEQTTGSKGTETMRSSRCKRASNDGCTVVLDRKYNGSSRNFLVEEITEKNKI